ncbi:hypothetical protein P5673_031233 [Acropora cervicornis]|uniref:SANT domain-containing protein n=1 Tax=Acropora cervicornis TaxID=6130 RepID=A0AAD9PTF1_ACRCE|nr:hypothetical protein P5673_031233 [Acropora cervicornis]
MANDKLSRQNHNNMCLWSVASQSNVMRESINPRISLYFCLIADHGVKIHLRDFHSLSIPETELPLFRERPSRIEYAGKKFAKAGKDFPLIAVGLPNKTIAQCVHFYYITKHETFYKQLRKMAMEEQHITRSFKSRALRGRETKKPSKERAGLLGKGIPKSKAVCSRHSDNNQRLRTTRSSARTTGENLSVENDKRKSTFKNERVIDETDSAKERTASKTEELPVRTFKEHNASSSLHKGSKQRKGKTLPSGDYHIKRISQDQLSLTDNHLSSGEYQDINLQHVLPTDKTQDKTAIKPKVLNHPQSIMGFRNGTSQKRPTHNSKMRKKAHNTAQYHAEATRAGQSAGKICDDFSCEVPTLTKTQAGKHRNSMNKEKSRSFKGKLIGAPAIGRKGLVKKTTRKQLRAAKVMMTIKNSFTPGIKDTMPEATQLCGKYHCGDGLAIDNHASNEKKRIVENVINDENKYQTAQGRRLQNFFPVAKGMRPQCNLSKTKERKKRITTR